MKVAAIVRALEATAPPQLAEEWDNVGLLAGSDDAEVRTLLVCVDLTADVLAEAVRGKVQMVLTHHPVIPKGTPAVSAGRAPALYEAVRRNIAIYCMHTNFDAAPGGTSDVLAEAMGLASVRPLRSSLTEESCKIVSFVPPDDLSRVSDAAFSAGAGYIGNYHDCAFFSHGIGAFCGGEGTHPTVGRSGEHQVVEEIRLEVIAPRGRAPDVCAAIRGAHGYETPAIDVYPLLTAREGWGHGRVGRTKRPVTVDALIARVKRAIGVRRVIVSGRPGGGVKKGNLVTVAACCAGSGRSCVAAARASGAGLYLTGELGYHDCLDASRAGLTVVLLGHGNSERIAMRRLSDRLDEALKGVRVRFARSDRDPFEIV